MNASTRAGAGIDYGREFAVAADWLARHAVSAGVRSPVPTCPGWSVLDLVTHVGNMHSWAATIVETGRLAAELHDEPASTRARRVADWYLGKAEDLYSVLRDTPDDRPCWNFAFGTGTASFWSRRQAHETLMHGADLALSQGADPRLPAGLAADGVDETLTVFLHRMHRRGHAADLVRPVCLRAVDVELSWVVEPPPKGEVPAQASPSEGRRAGKGDPAVPRVTSGHRSGVDLVEAPAAVLLLVLWKRLPLDHESLRLTGDRERILRFLGSRLTA